MRIISGKYGKRPLKAVSGQNTRPTTDKIKESLFNVLGNNFNGGYCLDFYGGSGSLGIEAVSRGMDHAVITEQYRPALQIIKENIEVTKEPERFTILGKNNRTSLLQYKNQNPMFIPFKLVFLDPPYETQSIVEDIEWLEANSFLASHAIIVAETGKRVNLEVDSTVNLIKKKEYGQTILWIYERGI